MISRTMRTRGDTAPWDGLQRELDLWAGAGRVASLWWRDDDAVRATPALDRLLAVSHGVPLALAVIPAEAEPFSGEVAVLQHGWAHADNARRGERKCELVGPGVVARLREGKQRLERLFGDRFLPVIVPPWNRLGRDVAAALPGIGYIGLSVLGARRTRFESNVHVDVMNWADRCFAGTGEVLRQLVDHLGARRKGEVDREEPTGIMTHHLVHGAATEDFMADLLGRTRAHPAARWLAAREVFGAA